MNKEKAIVIYFSHSGNTRSIAEEIASLTKADLFEIVPETTYPRIYQECVDQASIEKREQARPPIKYEIKNLKNYDTVYLGFPNWWSTVPMIIINFLESHDLSGKKIRPFVTHGGGGIANSVFDIKDIVKDDTTVESPFVIFDGDIQNATNYIKEWINKKI